MLPSLYWDFFNIIDFFHLDIFGSKVYAFLCLLYFVVQFDSSVRTNCNVVQLGTFYFLPQLCTYELSRLFKSLAGASLTFPQVKVQTCRMEFL